MSDIGLSQQLAPDATQSAHNPAIPSRETYINLAMVKTELQVIVNSLIGDLAEQRKI